MAWVRLPWPLGYLGLHVVPRGVLLLDIASAGPPGHGAELSDLLARSVSFAGAGWAKISAGNFPIIQNWTLAAWVAAAMRAGGATLFPQVALGPAGMLS